MTIGYPAIDPAVSREARERTYREDLARWDTTLAFMAERGEEPSPLIAHYRQRLLDVMAAEGIEP